MPTLSGLDIEARVSRIPQVFCAVNGVGAETGSRALAHGAEHVPYFWVDAEGADARKAGLSLGGGTDSIRTLPRGEGCGSPSEP